MYIDNTLVETHLGAFSPFAVDITDKVKPGSIFELKVVVSGSAAVKDSTGNYFVYPVGGWMDSKSGINDDVWLRAYGKIAIEDAFVQTFVSTKQIKIKYEVKNYNKNLQVFRLKGSIVSAATGNAEKEILSELITISPGEIQEVEVVSPWENPMLYWPDDPQMYHLKSELLVEDNIIDTETRRFGFREITIEGINFYWNGVRINLYGDYQTFGDSYYVNSSFIHTKEKWPNTVDDMKSINIRCMRWHHNPVPQYILDVCDEKGMLVCDESANWARAWMKTMPDNIRNEYISNYKKTIGSWIKIDRNHPSVYMWNATNEMTYPSLGNFTNEQCLDMGKEILKYDTTRPVGYDGDIAINQELVTYHYPEGYNKQPSGSIYTWDTKAGGRSLAMDKPYGSGEMLHTKTPESKYWENCERNTWWLGIWTRGLRYNNWTDVRPACYWFTTKDRRSTNPKMQQRTINLKNAYNPIALFDKEYDDLGITPYVTETTAGGTLPTIEGGAWTDRTLILYNDDFKGTSISIDVKVKIDTKVYAAGTGTFTVECGEHITIPYRFQVPDHGAQTMSLVLKTIKDGKVRFEEERKFIIKSKNEKDSISTSDQINFNSDDKESVSNTNVPQKKVYINGTILQLDVEPQIKNDRILIPMRTIFEALGAKIEWNSVEATVTGTKGERTVIVSIGSKMATVNGQQKELDVAAEIFNNRTVVPLRFIAESLGAEVDWEEVTQSVKISLKDE